MATYSSILAWKIQWTEEPGRLQSMGSQIVGHDCDSARMNKWEDEWKENGLPPLNISLLKGKREKSSRAPHRTPLFRTYCCSLQELSLNTLHSTCYYLILFFFVLLSPFYQDVSSMRAKPHDLVCYFLRSVGHKEGARYVLKKRVRGQVYAYHGVRHVTSALNLPWLLCEATLNITAIGRSMSSSSNMGQESSVELHLQPHCSCWSIISAIWNGILHRFPQSSFEREVQLFRILSLSRRREDTFYFDSTPILIHSVYQSASKLVGIYWAPPGSKVVLWLSNWVWNINHIVKPKLSPQVVESAIQVVRFSSCRLYFVMMGFYFIIYFPTWVGTKVQ